VIGAIGEVSGAIAPQDHESVVGGNGAGSGYAAWFWLAFRMVKPTKISL